MKMEKKRPTLRRTPVNPDYLRRESAYRANIILASSAKSMCMLTSMLALRDNAPSRQRIRMRRLERIVVSFSLLLRAPRTSTLLGALCFFGTE